MTETSFHPDWVSPPGDTIADALEEQGMTQADLAIRTGFSRKHVNDLIRGRATITADTAMRLESVVGGSARFWLDREVQYREAMARR
ncbi:MAG: HigA family addiction module antidote protein [Myxococcales bacterium]|nr:HigA family addiction module antidote protein [Myxococcales bacterium]